MAADSTTSPTNSLAEQLCQYYQNYQLEDVEQFLQAKLPQVWLLYPLRNPAVLAPFREFHQKFYIAGPPRTLILGINPGRLGAGLTGIQFTDTLRLQEYCGIDWPLPESREISSAYVYEMIRAFAEQSAAGDSVAHRRRQGQKQEQGQPLAAEACSRHFYQNFLLQSLLPLGFVRQNDKDKEVNYNFYDDAGLLALCRDKIARHLQTLVSWGCRRDCVFCLGSGKNLQVLQQLNKQLGLFERIQPLEHPRYIMQYKYRQRQDYIDKYCKLLGAALTA